jgi:D-glycero-alpha-D-manno-heptose-7-phosphate kinase
MNLEAIKHPVIKKLLEIRKIKSGLDIVHSGDLPARSGIGSSSSFTVGLMKGLYSLDNKKISNLNSKSSYNLPLDKFLY